MSEWIKSHFEPSFIFTAWSSVNLKISGGGCSFYARTNYFIFGVRVASIQQNKPWE